MARKNNKGGYEPNVLTVVEKIDELKSEVDQGLFQTHGVNDILSAALGKQPNGSRVQRLGKLITPTLYFHIPKTANLLEQRMAIERKVYEERFQMMMEMMDAKLNGTSRTEIGSCSYVNTKSPTVGDDDKNAQSKAKRKAADIIEEDSPKNGQSTAKTKVAHMMEANSHNERKLAKTPSVKTEKKTPRKSPNQQRKQEDHFVFCLGSKAPPPMKPKVIKAATSRKLVMRKNTRLVAQERKNSSAAINMFSVIVENFLQKEILIEHDESIFGYQTVTLLTKDVCQVIIDFAALRNKVIEQGTYMNQWRMMKRYFPLDLVR
ncbi:uncharacterized protein LOC127900439 [Citrus sinensis]|uniref:uncharacterized protein LOC127900439 n=1 Tax=Citrus sinensis TaxID=2711 RepID=UPI002278F2C0|nr:uncharacterized protein LOC127900439 [Citrus sinensis]XP_052291483.1 uncharacterized protein LOC127900439 [Citrus sinensis]XP_052291484.1 uncharacterized protein LOC127900439 [Citrus sinensis]XP_052291485.1 uncharacterized protein LOC127900439 [Citrus sinensis]XP_052291486.1 uncharacterized protein LOC127900439 [Citrus sinensis]